MPAFIVTLAGMLLFRGGNQFIGNANTIPVPEGFQDIGSGFLPEFGPNTGYNNAHAAARPGSPSRGGGLAARSGPAAPDGRWAPTRSPMLGHHPQAGPSWSASSLFATLRFASGRVGTSFPISGHHPAASWSSSYSSSPATPSSAGTSTRSAATRHAAELSGVKLKRVNFFVMMNMSVLAALAGMIFVARSTASGPQDGVGWELDAIAAVFIGGAAVTGGVGTVIGSIVGGLVMAVLNNGLQLLGVGADRVQIIKGLVLLLAVAHRRLQQEPGAVLHHRDA